MEDSMKTKKVCCIAQIILLGIISVFVLALTCACAKYDSAIWYSLSALCLIAGSIAFAVIALYYNRMFALGTLICNCIAAYLLACTESVLGSIALVAHPVEHYLSLYTYTLENLADPSLALFSSVIRLVFLALAQLCCIIVILYRDGDNSGIKEKRKNVLDSFMDIKFLYDSGAITQEEFDKLKQQKMQSLITSTTNNTKTIDTSNISLTPPTKYLCKNGSKLILNKNKSYVFESSNGTPLISGNYDMDTTAGQVALHRQNCADVILKITKDGLQLKNGDTYVALK